MSTQPNGTPAAVEPVIIYTERLRLKLADPNNDADCAAIVSVYTDPNGGKGGNSKVGVTCVADVRSKFKVAGPWPELCTRAPPPYGHIFLIRDRNESDEGPVMGMIGMSFRPGVPYPDIGYGLMKDYEGKGIATEAGQRVLDWWREEIGVREIWCGTMPDNERSQRCAQRIGFVRAGTIDVVFGNPPTEEGRVKDCCAFVLPGMEGEWKQGREIHPTIY